MKPGVIERPQLDHHPHSSPGEGWMVTVFDNDRNTYAEVMAILMLATRCGEEEAYVEAWEIDHFGSCVVHRSSQENCIEVADIIAKIGIKVEATPEP